MCVVGENRSHGADCGPKSAPRQRPDHVNKEAFFTVSTKNVREMKRAAKVWRWACGGMTNESKSCSPRPSVCVFLSPTGPLPDPRRTPSCPPDSNKRSRSAVMTDSRERAHFETPRPGPSAQENKRSWAHHLARCSKFSSLWARSRHPEFFWGPPELSISVALHSGGHMKPPGAPEVPMDARKRKGLIGTKVRGERLRGPGARCVVKVLKNGHNRKAFVPRTSPKI